MQNYGVPIVLLLHYSGRNFHYSWFFVIFAGNERKNGTYGLRRDYFY